MIISRFIIIKEHKFFSSTYDSFRRTSNNKTINISKWASKLLNSRKVSHIPNPNNTWHISWDDLFCSFEVFDSNNRPLMTREHKYFFSNYWIPKINFVIKACWKNKFAIRIPFKGMNFLRMIFKSIFFLQISLKDLLVFAILFFSFFKRPKINIWIQRCRGNQILTRYD